MSDVILFRFHDNFEICADRLAQLRELAPNTPIHGLYGGPPHTEDEARRALEPFVVETYTPEVPADSFTRSPEGEASWRKNFEGPVQIWRWNWLNSDLAVRQWYDRRGRDLPWDVLYLIEWDLLFLEPLERAYRHVGPNQVALTLLRPISAIKDEWYWTTHEPWKSQFEKLVTFVREKYDHHDELIACQGPGPRLPRAFLDAYARLTVPELSNDEVRLPLFARIAGFEVVDTGFAKPGPDDAKFFNCHNQNISESTIAEERAKPDGRRVFHPVREPYFAKLSK